MAKWQPLLVLIFTLSLINSAKSAEVIEEDLLLGASVNGGAAAENQTEGESKNSTAAAVISFITKPLSLFLSAEDEVESDNGTKETYLERTTRLAEAGDLENQMNLAYMYLYGTNGVKEDYDLAFKYYAMAAEQNDPIALNNLGSLYFSGIGTKVSHKTALALFEKSAELGNDNAAVNLAFIYLTGNTKDMARNQKAVKLFQQASKAGNKIAHFMLGYAYYRGFVVEKNYSEALKLIQVAAGGDSQLDEAQLVLAEMYINGYGTVQNYQKAVASVKAAMRQGNTEALMILGKIYAKGEISAPNRLMAHALYNIAASQNVPGAEQKRDKIAETMKLQELTQAQELAQQYKADPSELTSYVRQTFGTEIRHYIDNNMVK